MFEEDFFPLKVVPDWFVTREGLYMWHDEDYWYHDDEITEWYEKTEIKNGRPRKHELKQN